MPPALAEDVAATVSAGTSSPSGSGCTSSSTWGTLIVLSPRLCSPARSRWRSRSRSTRRFRSSPSRSGAGGRSIRARRSGCSSCGRSGTRSCSCRSSSAAGLLGLIVGAPFGACARRRPRRSPARCSPSPPWCSCSATSARGDSSCAAWTSRCPDSPPSSRGCASCSSPTRTSGPHTNRRFLERVVDDGALARAGHHRRHGRPDRRPRRGRRRLRARARLARRAARRVHDRRQSRRLRGLGRGGASRCARRMLGTVLVNEVQLLHRGDATLALVGTGDPAGGRAARRAPRPTWSARSRACPRARR